MPLEPPPAEAMTKTRGVLSRKARPVWLTDCIDHVGIGGLGDFPFEPGQQPLVIVHKGQAAQGARTLRLQRTRHGIELLTRQPFRQ